MRAAAGVFAIAVMALGCLSGSSLAQTEEKATVQHDVEESIICPCPNCSVLLLSTCFCGKAQETKQEIREMAAQGMSSDEIVTSFVERYGERIRAKPEERGFNLVGYWFPTAALLGGAVAVGLFIRRAVKRGKKPAPEEPPALSDDKPSEPMDEYEERLQRELRSLG
jgi:cytochrome c-type biogenesis protein CcmH/NrfF